MGLVGGNFVYKWLKRSYPGGQGCPVPADNLSREKETSKVRQFFGDGIFDELRNKTVADYGCGSGWTCIELALNGVQRAIGIDIVEKNLESGRRLAIEYGVSDRCSFILRIDDKVDAIISLDAFEHFEDPASVLSNMRKILKDDGVLFVTFGYTWYHPLGGHLFSVFPWAHLIFTEKTLIRWRSDFKTDGATRFREVGGGLNGMSIRRWEQILADSPFQVEWRIVRPIRAVRWLYCSLTRELFTSTLQYKLVPKKG
jgi:SAM-dependent methyltransferase